MLIDLQEDMMRRGVLATGSIQMLKPSDRRRRLRQEAGLNTGPQSQQAGEQVNHDGRDETSRPIVDQTREERPVMTSSAAALDLDLFDPDEED